MISTDQIVMQIEKQLQKAKMGNNEQVKREALAAISALCAVALDAEFSSIESLSVTPITVQNTPLKDSDGDANGESLFDF